MAESMPSDEETAEFAGALFGKMHDVAVQHVLGLLDHSHLKAPLAGVSSRFKALARALVEEEELQGPELVVALRKLLEAKDAAVRAKVAGKESVR